MSEIKPRDFPDIWAFVRVVECGSFSEAARQMASTKANVSKQVARLERSLATRLLNRSTRKLSLTEAGQEIYQHAARMTEEARAIESKVAGMRAAPSGTLRVSTSIAFGNAHLAALLPGFMERYPDVRVMLNLSDRYVDLVEEGFDLALRLASTINMVTLVARPIAPLNYVLAASPAYISRFGAPSTIDALKAHRCLVFADTGRTSVWTLAEDGKTVQLKVDSALSINGSQSLREAMLGGAGIALLPTYIVGDDIVNGNAVHVLPSVKAQAPFGSHLYAVYMENRFLPQKVRVFIDYLVEKIGAHPYWDRFLD
jgi:DNA-binding transcriptional LysR family regulator